MSAIAGLAAQDGDSEVWDAVPRLDSALSHRGPSATWMGGQVLLTGHGTRPVTDPQTGAVIVADARIDNRTELPAAGPTDAELILAAYRAWGTDCVTRLLGDFAFVIYDPRTNLIFCARDPMGVKPLYYHHSPQRFAFGTEIQALLQHPHVPTTIDDNQVALYLAMAPADRTSTFYQQIKRLPAAHTLTVTAGKLELREYWRVDAGRTIRLANDAEYAAGFSERFRAAVGARLRDASPVGASLSGGLDSSSIVCTARQLGAPLHTFSLVFPSLEGRALRAIDERAYVEQVVATGGVQAHYVRGDELSPLANLATTMARYGQPFAGPNLYLHQGMYAAAREAGVRVFLDGFDGDTTVSHGLSRLNDLARDGEWSTFEREVRAFAEHRAIPVQNVLPYYGFPLLEQLARGGHVIRWTRAARELARRFSLSRREVVQRYGVAPMWSQALQAVTGTTGSSVLRSSWRRRVASYVRDAASRDSAQTTAGERAMHLNGLNNPLYQQVLELADAAAADYGIEPRYPFFDRRLIEYCVSLPSEQKFCDGWPRYVMRHAMEGVLPRDIQWRSTKSNLAHNFTPRTMNVDGALLKNAAFDAVAPYVDMAQAKQIRVRALAGSHQDLHVATRLLLVDRWLGSTKRTRRAA